jgi:hypothetical protein
MGWKNRMSDSLQRWSGALLTKGMQSPLLRPFVESLLIVLITTSFSRRWKTGADALLTDSLTTTPSSKRSVRGKCRIRRKKRTGFKSRANSTSPKGTQGI